MRIFGLEITRARSKAAGTLAPVDNRGGWWPIIREPFTGAWQRNQELRQDDVLSYAPVFACISLIANDIAKLRIKLVQNTGNDIWQEIEAAAFSPVLRKPNHYQNRIRFLESWVISKLARGNTYILKQRDGRGVVIALYVLDPSRVAPLVAPDGSVYYQLMRDDLSLVGADLPAIPASEIIHDRMNTLYHPLVGIPPLYANNLAALQGVRIQNGSAQFFANGSTPGGILTAPGEISDETAARLKAHWEKNYSGNNIGKIAVLGDGLKYEPMAVKAVDAQLVEQLKLSAEIVCTTFHVPRYMIGVGPDPSYNNVGALQQQYYSQCLQTLIESIELCLDEGLALPATYGTELDTDALLRMDMATRYKAHSDAIGGGWLSPNEARAREDLPAVEGGDSPMIQQQNYSLSALAKRDAMANPFAPESPAAPAEPAAEPDDDDDESAEDMARVAALMLEKKLATGPGPGPSVRIGEL